MGKSLEFIISKATDTLNENDVNRLSPIFEKGFLLTSNLYQKAMVHSIMSARKETSQLSRLEIHSVNRKNE
jgi:hypothetical protein